MIMILGSKNSRKKAIVTSVVFFFITILTCLAYVYIFNGNIFGWTYDNGTSQTVDNINHSPPSNQEIDEGQNAKKNLIDKAGEEKTNSNSNEQSVEVGIANTYKSASNLEIRAFIPGIIEGSGRCTATLSKSTNKVAKSADGFIDSSATICKPIVIPLSQFSENGDWNLVVSYSSSKYSGTSSPMEIKI